MNLYKRCPFCRINVVQGWKLNWQIFFSLLKFHFSTPTSLLFLVKKQTKQKTKKQTNKNKKKRNCDEWIWLHGTVGHRMWCMACMASLVSAYRGRVRRLLALQSENKLRRRSEYARRASCGTWHKDNSREHVFWCSSYAGFARSIC